MKRFLPILMLVSLFIGACTPGEDETGSLSVTPQSLSFTGSDNSHKILNITASSSWQVAVSADWIKLSKSSGSGNGSVTVSVEANNATASRSGKITLTASSAQPQEVSVTQEGSGVVAVVPAPAAFDGIKRASTTYQLLIYSFADSDGDGVGDFKGIQEKLDYLDELGVTALWLSPAHPTNSYHAYDVNDYFSINSLYATGTGDDKTADKAEAEFKELIDAAKAKGIKIYMDYVLNHSGTNTEWFKSVKADPQNSHYKDYYVLTSNYPAVSTGGMGGWVSFGGADIGYKGLLHFKVDWGHKTVTVSETTEAAQLSNDSASLWLWIGSKAQFVGLYETSSNVYEITLDVDTDWGFLITTTNNWDTATKWGGKAQANVVKMGTPLSLTSTDVQDIVFAEVVSYWASFDKSMPDLNYGNYTECENSRAFKSTVESAIKWVNLGVEGFRLDAVYWVYQKQQAANVRFLDQWYQAVNKAYKDAGHTDNIFMVGEAWCDGGHNEERNYYQGLTSCFEFSYWGVLAGAINNGNGRDYASTVSGFIKDHAAKRSDAITSFFMTNHDKTSIKKKQVGDNWEGLYRAADDLGRDLAKEKQAAAMMLTTGGKPFVYQGEELGYWRDDSKNDDEYLRAPIVWDAAASKVAKKGVNNKVDAAMLKGSISVETQSADENSLLNVYKTWSRLRNTYPALAIGEMSTTSLTNAAIASWYMTSGSQRLLVIHNVASSEKEVSVSDSMDKPIALLGTASVKGTSTLILGPNSSVVFEL